MKLIIRYLFIVVFVFFSCFAWGTPKAFFEMPEFSSIKGTKSGLPSPPLNCLKVETNGDITIYWSAVQDPNSTFIAYRVFSATNINGPYTQIVQIANRFTNSYLHVGANANSASRFYFVQTVSDSSGVSIISTAVDTAQSIFLQLVNPGNNGTAQLSWNSLYGSISPTFTIQRSEGSVGNWSSLDSTNNLSFTDSFHFCSQTLNYKIFTIDNQWLDGNGNPSTCQSVSNVQDDLFLDLVEPPAPIIDSVSVNPVSGNVEIGWDVNTAPDIAGYIIYIATGSLWTPMDTIYGKFSTFFTDSVNFPCAGDYLRYRVAAMDSCTRTSILSVPHNTMFLKTVPNICQDQISLQWNSYKLFYNGLARYDVFVSIDGGNWTLLSQNLPSDTFFTHAGLLQKADYKYLIRAVSNDGSTSSSCQSTVQIRKPLDPKFVYIRSASVKSDNSGVELLIYTDTSGVASDYEVFSSEDGTTWNTVGSLPPDPTNPNLIFDYPTNKVTEKALYFRVSVSDSCGNPLLISDSTLTIFLQVVEQDAYNNRLDWSAYSGFLNKNGSYQIYRFLDPLSFPVLLGQVPANQLFYIDDISALTSSSGIFSYFVTVSEKGPNPNAYGFLDSARSNTTQLIKESVIVFPNAFHPTSPILENRIFRPLGAFINPENYLFQIFDRWGRLVFVSDNPVDFWDGTENGKDLPGDVYVYLLKYQNLKGEIIHKKGTVTMIR